MEDPQISSALTPQSTRRRSRRNQIHLCRDNRRSHSRVEASIEDSRWLAVDNTAFRTKDLSEGGMLIEMEQEVLLGALGNFELNLPDGHRRWGVGQIGRGFRRAAAASKSASNFSPRY